MASLLSVLALSSCGGGGSTFCDGVKSVSDYVAQFAQGLDNFSEDRYTQLRLDSLDALDVVEGTTDDPAHGADAKGLRSRLRDFVTAMDDVSWDVSRALENESAVSAAGALATPEALAQANSVESVVISRCGLPTTIPPLVGSDTLPYPSVPAPTATDPPSAGPNEDSEAQSTGQMVATQFGLTLSPTEVLCLGRELGNVIDDGSGDPASTYQRAFDVCGIDFTVPRD